MAIAIGTIGGLWAGWVVLSGLTGCSGSASDADDPPGEHSLAAGWGGEQPSQKGLYKVRLASEPASPETGDLFTMALTLQSKDGTPIDDATVSLDAQMPQHGHGMMTRPALIEEDHADGVYRFEGFKFHMRGRWTLEATIETPAGHDTHLVVYEQQ